MWVFSLGASMEIEESNNGVCRYNGFVGHLERDPGCENPRNSNVLCHMVCGHKRYTLGDTHSYNLKDFDGWDSLEAKIKQDSPGCYILPIYMLDHSGLWISTRSFSCPWDSGQIGFIYLSKETFEAEFSDTSEDLAESIMKDEIEIYDQYLKGECYGYIIENQDREEVDSCWGYIGRSNARSALLDAIQRIS
jgi:hypothetical protein